MIKHVEKGITSPSAKIMYEGQPEGRRLFSNKQLENFRNRIKSIPDEEKRYEAEVAWHYLEYGKKIVLEKKKHNKRIRLYLKKEVLDREPDDIITCNPELFVLLEQLLQS